MCGCKFCSVPHFGIDVLLAGKSKLRKTMKIPCVVSGVDIEGKKSVGKLFSIGT